MLDHFVYAVPDLAAAVDGLQEQLGVRPAPSGRHMGRGTHNALLALGVQSYLEVIAPDPQQPSPSTPRPFGLDAIHTPRLLTWAVRTDDIDSRVAAARVAGYDPGDVQPLSRALPDGRRLAWRLTVRRDPLPGGGLVPFLIDWADAPHPAANAPRGCTLVRLRAEHPQPESLRPLLAALEVELELTSGPLPALIASLATSRGAVELR